MSRHFNQIAVQVDLIKVQPTLADLVNSYELIPAARCLEPPEAESFSCEASALLLLDYY